VDSWILVTDRLPKKGQSVLVCGPDVAINRTIFKCGKIHETGFEVVAPHNGRTILGLLQGVTHWMPLPLLPEFTGKELIFNYYAQLNAFPTELCND
jgi:hypothetical protein